MFASFLIFFTTLLLTHTLCTVVQNGVVLMINGKPFCCCCSSSDLPRAWLNANITKIFGLWGDRIPIDISTFRDYERLADRGGHPGRGLTPEKARKLPLSVGDDWLVGKYKNESE